MTETDLLRRLETEGQTLTPKLRAIAAYALKETETFIRNTSRELCADLGVSEPTLIRFCREFGHTGLSEFRINLALSLAHQSDAGTFIEPLPTDRRLVNMDAKRAIAERAAQLVTGDSSFLIDNGSTAEFFASALADHAPMTVMTTGLIVARNLLSLGKHEVMMTGGTIRPDAMAMTGRLVESSLAHMRFDAFVMSADSVSAAAGLSTYREDEAHSNRAMIAASSRVIVLADSTKFSKPALHNICRFNAVATLVTDLPEESDELRAIRAQGVEVFCVRPDASAASDARTVKGTA
ncbi:DeoR/GlpR family DNA-binding transcription regulator [Celeribacter indicus]|uniref:Transcriptional repressor of aga operon n=1 Tax=Celeribacter indicus TaxID=1208324 RepID=A0A0B5DZ73_9RHOB|nr:transcriptional regulator [Celeribacter indicus]AJE48713.1 transcriptional repressor of aga operon [Celeribacter indicus]SDX12300.1 transcriptional regulator, RpiR family [Celeribacter indicus]